MINPFVLDAKIDKDQNLTIVTAQNITPILEDCYNARKYSRKLRRRNKKGVGEWIGRVPALVFEEWMRLGLVHPPGCDCGLKREEHQKMLHMTLQNYNEGQYKTTKKTL